VKDRSEEARLRRDEMREQHLLEGKEYLENVKVRYIKTMIGKFMAYSALEKKLYQERLNN
jgi:hypothetical protein